MNDLFLRALKREKVERPPIWIMRQAGRYLPEYRALRAQHSFQTLVHTPELAAQVTHLPVDLFGFDAAILFSDILVVGEVFGFEMDFVDKGMQLRPPAQEITLAVESTLHYVPKTIQLLKKILHVPLIGFCGGPYTVCRYMQRITPEWLNKVTDVSIEYLKLQIQAGVDVLQIFDSWAGLLSPEEFHTLALPYLTRIVQALKPSGVPVILFCRGSSRFIPELAALQPAAIGFDWEMEMAEVRKQVPSPIAVQGNLNPALLSSPLSELKPAVNHLLNSMKNSPGYIFNLGHGIEPAASVDNVRWLIHHIQNTTRT
ncbi:MAG: uroporphyrinogen decarboxylase [Rhabdochlamydiaceae bacterium]